MKSIIWFGAILTLLGTIGLAMPVFTTSQTKDVARLGDIKVQSSEQTTRVVPQLLSGGALILGIILIGAGTLQQRSWENSMFVLGSGGPNPWLA